MRIIRFDRKEGSIKLKIETPEDIWHLSKVLEPGDLVRGKTKRKITIKRGQEIIKGEHKPVTLTIEAEKISFHKDTGKLRITGKIKEGPEDIDLNSYHTIQIEQGMVLIIKKEWKKYQIERLEKAKIKQPLIFICMIDRERADFASLKESGVELLGSITSRKSKMGKEDEDKDSYYKQIMDVLERQRDHKSIIIAGPGFERENLYNYIKEKQPSLLKKIVLEHASDTGRPGINEVLKKSADKVLLQTRIVEETQWVEKFLAEIKKDGLAVYGKEETRKATEYGAVETLLVSEEKLSEFEDIIEKAEKQSGKIVIITSNHEAGDRFFNIGGIGGFLRFKINK
jgi:protein pelota